MLVQLEHKTSSDIVVKSCWQNDCPKLGKIMAIFQHQQLMNPILCYRDFKILSALHQKTAKGNYSHKKAVLIFQLYFKCSFI